MAQSTVKEFAAPGEVLSSIHNTSVRWLVIPYNSSVGTYTPTYIPII